MEDNYSVYVHKVDTEEGSVYYTGVTNDIKRRWQPSLYKGMSLWGYIVKYGWDDIDHQVIAENLSYEKSREVEDMLIRFYSSIGKCINQQRSGLISVKDPNAYQRELYRNNEEYREHCKEYQKEYQKEWRGNNKEYYREYQKEYHKQYDDKYNIKRLESPEGKIYGRVASFNHNHPDKAIETPLEAKRKYLETGYIPDYIKNDDFFFTD